MYTEILFRGFLWTVARNKVDDATRSLVRGIIVLRKERDRVWRKIFFIFLIINSKRAKEILTRYIFNAKNLRGNMRLSV